MEKITRASFIADKQFLKSFLPAAVLLMGLCSFAQTTVTYNLGNTGYFSTPFTSGSSGIYQANSNTELGMYAHGGDSKQCAVWRDFKTAGDNTGTVRALQVGDVFTIQVYAASAFGQIGFSLNTANVTGSWANRIANSRIYIQEDGTNGSWYVNNAAGNQTLDYNVSNTNRDYIFKVYITSETTCDVELIAGGVTTKRLFNVTMNGAAGTNITGFSLYQMDDWNGSSNQDVFWKQVTEVRAGTSVSLGYYLAAGNYTPGIIKNGFTAGSTSTVSVNKVNVGGDPGSTVILNKANTYTGATTVNALARMELQNAQGAGNTSGITVQNTGALSLFSSTGINYNTYPLTLNGAGQNGSNGALRNVGGDNIWNGSINTSAGTEIRADVGGSLTLKGDINGSGLLTLTAINPITISGSVSNTISSVTKNGSGVLTLTKPGAFATPLLINAGTVAINSTASYSDLLSALSGAGSVAKSGSGTLELFLSNTYTGTTTIDEGLLAIGADERIANASNIVLAGGTLSTGRSTGYSETVGTLNVSSASTISLGTGSHSLTFANSSAIAWNGASLTIAGWNGTAGQSNTSGGKIIVGVGGLTAAQLAKISFSGYNGKPVILSSGELVPPGPTLAVIEGALNHGSACLGTAAAEITYTIMNTGAATGTDGVTVVSSSPEFNVHDISQPVAVAGGYKITYIVTFIPSGPGTRSAAITINTTVPNSNAPITGTVTGIGNANIIYYADRDGDGYGDELSPLQSCTGAPVQGGHVAVLNSTDCNDDDVFIYHLGNLYIDADNDGWDAGQTEVCYGMDAVEGYSFSTSGTDCDDTDAQKRSIYTYYTDADGDTYGTGSPIAICALNAATAPAGFSVNETDCNDNDGLAYRSGILYTDADNDGYNDGQDLVCYGSSVPTGMSLDTLGFDCDDNNAATYKNVLYYVDADSDGYDTGYAYICSGNAVPPGYALTSLGTDCDDANALKHEGAGYYVDADGDGYDTGTAYVCSGSSVPSGYALSTLGYDCDDANAAIYNYLIYYIDADGDGYDSGTTYLCSGTAVPAGYSLTTSGDDCNDNDNTLTVNCPIAATINLKLFIEGYYTGAGMMASVKYNQDYESAADVVEELTVELHTADNYEMAYSTTAMLHTNGTMTCTFPTAPNGSYYIAVKGSNIIQTWSALPQFVSASVPTAYDFTTSQAQAYADNTKDMGGVFAIYSGDLNHDDVIDPNDYVIWEADFNNFSFGVFASDITGDGVVDPNDYVIWESNFNGFVFAYYPS